MRANTRWERIKPAVEGPAEARSVMVATTHPLDTPNHTGGCFSSSLACAFRRIIAARGKKQEAPIPNASTVTISQGSAGWEFGAIQNRSFESNNDYLNQIDTRLYRDFH